MKGFNKFLIVIVWAILAIAFLCMPLVASADSATERVRVAAAMLRAAQQAKPVLPDTPPDIKPIIRRAPMRLEMSEHGQTGDMSELSELSDIPELPELWLCVADFGCPACKVAKEALAGATDLPFKVVIKKPNQTGGIPIEHYPTLIWSYTAQSPGETKHLEKGNCWLQGWHGIDHTLKEFKATRKTGKRRLTAAELRAQAAQWDGPTVGVVGMTVLDHLRDETHGFTLDQLAGLSESELLAIHSANHHGAIVPFAESVAVGSRRDQRGKSAPLASSSIGTLHAKEWIQSGIDWFRWKVGENRPVSFKWDRTGPQEMPISRASVDPVAILGRSGRIELSVDEAVNLPVNALGFGYVLDGNDVEIDLDKTRLKRILSHFGDETTDDQPKAVGVSPGTILTIFSVIRAIYLLRHPKFDLLIGGNITAKCVLVGDTLTVTFDQGPGVVYTSFFRVQLRLESVEITTERVVCHFSGSRLMPQATFEVK